VSISASAHASVPPERHLDPFTRFAGLTIVTNTQTTQTDHATTSVATARIQHYVQAMWPETVNTTTATTDPVFGQHFGDDRADNSGDCSDAVRHAHENAGVARSYIQVIHVEPCIVYDNDTQYTHTPV